MVLSAMYALPFASPAIPRGALNFAFVPVPSLLPDETPPDEPPPAIVVTKPVRTTAGAGVIVLVIVEELLLLREAVAERVGLLLDATLLVTVAVMLLVTA